MKKLFVTIFIACYLCCASGYGTAFASILDEIVAVELCCSPIPPYNTQHGIKRAPARNPTAYIEGSVLSFPAFASDCTFEIMDAATEEIVYSLPVSASETSCQIPAGMAGEYLIRFVFEQYVFEGYVEL